MLEALEIRMADLTERAEALAAGEVANLLRAALGLPEVSFWDNSE